MSLEKAYMEVKPGSEKSFGFVFATIFVLIGLYPLLSSGSLRWWSLTLATILALLTLIRPTLLAKPNYWWFRFGMFLGAIVAPIVMAVVYFLAIVPTGIAVKLAGKDLLRIKSDKSAKSYWIKRDTPLQPMKYQF